MLDNSDKDYQIASGDVVKVQVVDAPELSREYQVYASGEIEMPVLGLIKAKQATTYSLARYIANRLRDEEYLKTPNVEVSISKYNNHTFFIQGSVQKPGAYQIGGQPSILTLVSLAGGLADNHGTSIFILRPRKAPLQTTAVEEPPVQALSAKRDATSQNSVESNPDQAIDYEMLRVNLNALYTKGEFDQNQKLEPGDIVNIPRADVFFVAGEVKAPGSFQLKDGTTLRQAITLAQGMTFRAKAAQGVIFREDPVLGARQEIKVDFNAVMSGKQDDIVVRANDVILIPNSRAKTIGGTLLTALGLSAARIPGR